MSIIGRVKELSQVPDGGRIINEERLAAFYEIAVRTWEPQREVLSLKYGSYVLGLAGSMSAWYGNTYFRKKLRLRNYGFFTMYLSNLSLPFLIVNAMQITFIQKSIFMRPAQCTICTEAKAATIQLFFGLIQPLIFIPASAFLFATRHFTQRIPSPYYYPRDFMRYLKHLYGPLKKPMAINSLFQVGLAMMITHSSIKEFHHLNENMLKPKTEEINTENKE